VVPFRESVVSFGSRSQRGSGKTRDAITSLGNLPLMMCRVTGVGEANFERCTCTRARADQRERVRLRFFHLFHFNTLSIPWSAIWFSSFDPWAMVNMTSMRDRKEKPFILYIHIGLAVQRQRTAFRAPACVCVSFLNQFHFLLTGHTT